MLIHFLAVFLCFWSQFSAVQVFCQKYFRDQRCGQVSSHKCQIADPVVNCWPLSVPAGYKCNSSGVFEQTFRPGCDVFVSDKPLALNPALGQCASTTFTQNGDGFFSNTCPNIASNNLIMKYNYFNFPTTYQVPTCTQPDALNLIPSAFESGTCYTLAISPNTPASISYTCSGGVVTENAYASSDCSSGVVTKTFNTGQCYSDNAQAPYADGYRFTCGTPTRSPTTAPTTGPPTVPTTAPPVGAPTQSASQKTWNTASIAPDFNSRKLLLFGGVFFKQSITGVTNAQVSGGVLNFNVTFSPTVPDSDKQDACNNLQQSIDNNYDYCTKYLPFSCSVSSPKKRQGSSTAVVTITDSNGGPGSSGGGLSGTTIAIIVGSVVGGMILFAILVPLMFYCYQQQKTKSGNDNYSSY